MVLQEEPQGMPEETERYFLSDDLKDMLFKGSSIYLGLKNCRFMLYGVYNPFNEGEISWRFFGSTWHESEVLRLINAGKSLREIMNVFPEIKKWENYITEIKTTNFKTEFKLNPGIMISQNIKKRYFCDGQYYGNEVLGFYEDPNIASIDIKSLFD